jgi:hypothetical protein
VEEIKQDILAVKAIQERERQAIRERYKYKAGAPQGGFMAQLKSNELLQGLGRTGANIGKESAGIGTQCLRANTRFIVMPRDYQYGELPAKSDMNENECL